MKKLSLFEHHLWHPFARFGLDSPFWWVNFDTLLYSWIAIFGVCILIFLGWIALKRPNGILAFLIKSFVKLLMSLVKQSLEKFNYRYCAFAGSLFIYIFISNLLVIFPYMEEPTKDLNTTLGLAIVSFLYVQREGIRVHGLWGYIKELSKPIFLFLPMEVMGKLATIISLSFRLFGNIFGGAVITGMWTQAISGSLWGQLAGMLLGINLVMLMFFGLFEGFIQAFVFSILTLTYLSMSILSHD